jgi:hypothetical protein
MKNSGLSESTLSTVSQKLNQLGRHADLQNPQEVLAYIANCKVSNATKQKLANDNNYYYITNRNQLEEANIPSLNCAMFKCWVAVGFARFVGFEAACFCGERACRDGLETCL